MIYKLFSLFNYLHKNIFNNNRINRFFNNLIHSMYPCFLCILFFTMSSTSHNHRLQDIFFSQKSSYLLTSFISINDRHRAVHENQTKAIVFFISIFDNLDGFMAIKSLLDDMRNVLITSLHEDYFETNYIIGFIIDDQDASIFVYLVDQFIFFFLFYLLLRGIFIFQKYVLCLFFFGKWPVFVLDDLWI